MAVAVVEEHAEVVRLAVFAKMAHETAADRAFGLNPLQLVVERMCLVEDARAELRRRRPAARLRDAEAADANAVDRVGAGLEFVGPRLLVARARREHFDVGMVDEMFGDVAGLEFCAAMYGRAVALNDKRQLHGVSGSPPPLSGSSGPSSS